MGPERTLVIVPAFNEEEALPRVLKELRASAEAFDIVVVDDGSTDSTGKVARAQGAIVLPLPFNLGIGGALRTGFLYAVEHGYERAVQFDGDGQHDPAELPALLAELDEGADLVIGSRFADRVGGYDVSKVRGGAMRLLRFTVRLFTGRSFTDTSSGFRGFSRPMLEYFARTYPYEYMESVEALLMASANGFDVREVPVQMRVREGGRPSNRRLRLLYHFLRVFLVISVSRKAPRRGDKRPAPGEDREHPDSVRRGGGPD